MARLLGKVQQFFCAVFCLYSTPARVSFQSQRQPPASPTEEVPMLYKKRKEAEISPDDRIMEEVKKNFLGECSHTF